MVKCRKLRDAKYQTSNPHYFKYLTEDKFLLRNVNFSILSVEYEKKGLVELHLHSGEFWYNVENKKLKKFCKKELKTYVLDEYAKLKQEEKLEKQKKKEFELKIVNDGFK